MTNVGFILYDTPQRNRLCEAIRLQPDMRCVLTVSHIDDFWTSLPEKGHLDILFLETGIWPQLDSDIVATIGKQFPQAEIILIATEANMPLLTPAFRAGATGCIAHDFPASQLPETIRIIREGGTVIAPQMMRHLLDVFQPARCPVGALNCKEVQLIRLFQEGITYEECAVRLGISIHGIRYHVKNIYRKLDVDNKLDAIRLYQEQLKLGA